MAAHGGVEQVGLGGEVPIERAAAGHEPGLGFDLADGDRGESPLAHQANAGVEKPFSGGGHQTMTIVSLR